MKRSAASTTNDALIAALETGGGDMIDVASIMPANILLELLGEDIRNRLCSFVGPDGEEMCLRPDMTVPIALKAVETGEISRRYRHSGPVFRFPTPGLGEATEFVQTGFEWIGGVSGPEEDIEGIALTHEALRSAGLEHLHLRCGDSALFAAFVDGLKLSAPWPERLKKAFSRKHGPVQLLERINGSDRRSPLAQALAALPEDEARQAVEEVFAVAGISPVGGRNAADVASRLMAQSREAQAGPAPQQAVEAVDAYLSITGAPGDCLTMIGKLARKHGIDMSGALEAFAARVNALDKAGLMQGAMFGAGFGRRFDYYDGVVFEFVQETLGSSRPVASGGRYDGLITRLSDGQVNANAFGVALRLDRIRQALGETA